MTPAQIKKEIDKIQDEISVLCDKSNKLKEERIKLIAENKEYLTDLSEYNGKTIFNITAIGTDSKAVGLPGFCYSVENGKLAMSNSEDGIIEWDDKRGYVHYFYNSDYELNIVGFIDVEAH